MDESQTDVVQFRTVTNGDIELSVATAGDGPLVVLVHGWPELWYSWRHQIDHLTARGYAVAALDVRGYGGSSNPTEVERYTLRELTGDVAAVIDALGDGPAIVVGHDWGAPIAWNTARLHPARVRAVVGMSVPYTPVRTTSSLELWEQIYAGRFFYQLYFREPGRVEAELGADHARSLRMIHFAACGEGNAALIADKPADATLLDGMIDPDPLPSYLTADDIAVYAAAFERSGWHGPINRYRAQDFDAADLGHLDTDPTITQPAAFIGGELDAVRQFVPGLDMYDLAPAACADFRSSTIVPGVGHWVQQEAPDEVNAALDRFLDGL